MKFLFKKPPEVARQRHGQMNHGGINPANAQLEKFMRRWAAWLAVTSAKYTSGQKTVFVTLAVLLVSAYNLMLIGGGLHPSQPAGRLQQISLPVALSPGEAEQALEDQHPGQRRLQKVMEFSRYLDSLSREPSARAEYHRIIASRPGLTDSLALFLQLYPSGK